MDDTTSVDSKSQSFQLYEAGLFGNKLRTWSNLPEIQESGYSGKVVMRHKGRMGGMQLPRLGEQVSISEAQYLYQAWMAQGVHPRNITFNEAAPDAALTLQGEFILSENHASLFCSTEKTVMRKAMQHGQQFHGLRALNLMRAHLSPSSYEDLQVLLDRHPRCVVEFSAYRHCLGSIAGRNTLIWEVRNY